MNEQSNSDQLTDPSEGELPVGSTIGLLGGGQLGMFFAQAATSLGMRVLCLSDHVTDPASRYADEMIAGKWEDAETLARFKEECEFVTYEFEKIPDVTLEAIAPSGKLRPSLELIKTTKDRAKEKQMLRRLDIPLAPFEVVETLDGLREAVEKIGRPCILKTALDGYDGKGQWYIDADFDIETWWPDHSNRRYTLEAAIDLAYEISVLVAGDQSDNYTTIGPLLNAHRNHILDVTSIPNAVDSHIGELARSLSVRIAEHFDLIGLMCVEFFVSRDKQLLVNEIAPRPHNSGHLTMEAFEQSQYDLQARAVTGRTISPSTQIRHAAMANLLGDVWDAGDPDFDAAKSEVESRFENVSIHLHLYGKAKALPGRKMGHVTILADNVDQATQAAREYRSLLVNDC